MCSVPGGDGGARPAAVLPAGPGAAAGSAAPAAAPWPRPVRPRLSAALLFRLHRLLAPRPFYRRLAGWLGRSPARYRIFARAEETVKTPVFGCSMCGQCALPVTAYTCPVTCPKQLRNGPCGGVGRDGSCEVHPGLRCVWLIAFERAERTGHVADLRRLQRPRDHRRQGQSSWVSYWHGDDDRLATAGDGLDAAPEIWGAQPRGGGGW